MWSISKRSLPISGIAAIFFAAALFSAAPNAHAAIPQLINFQGKVTNLNGTNVSNGTYSFVFKLYTASSGGSPTFTETQSLVVTDGIFQANLNAVNASFAGVDFTNAIWLGVAFNGDPEMSPRIQFTSSPYALNANNLGGLSSSGFVQLGPSSIQADSSTNTSIFINKTASGNLLQFQNATTPVFTVDNSGSLTIENSTNSANILQVQNAGGEQLLNIDATNVGGNIIVDPSFEAGISLWPTLGVGSPALTQATATWYEGKKSLRIVTDSTPNEGAKYVIGAVGNIPITFSAYVQLSTGSMSTFELGYSNDGSTLIPCLSSQTLSTQGWLRFSCHFTTASPTSSAFLYVRDTGNSHNFLIDAVTAVNTATVAPKPYENSAIALNGVITSPVAIVPDFNSVTAFQIQDTTGVSNLFVADTLNNQTTINGTGGTTNIGSTGSQASITAIHVADTSSSTANQVVTIGSIAANAGNITTIQGGNTASAVTIITAASGAVNIGVNNVATKRVNIGSVGTTAFDTTLHLGDTSGTSGQTITIGSNSAAANTTTIQGGNTAAAIALQTALNGNINIGTNAVTGKVVNIGSVSATAQATTIHIADTTATNVQTLTIGSNSATSNTTTIQGGSSTTAISLLAAASGGINVGTNAVTGKVVNIGSVGSTAQATTIHIADTTDATVSQILTIGSLSATGNTTLIQGANGVTLQTAASGSINIGTNNVATKTVNIGSVGSTAQTSTIHIADTTDSTVTQAITIGSNSAAANTLTLQGGTGVGAITAQVAAGGTINLASLTSAAANVIAGTVATTVSSSLTTTDLSNANAVGNYNSLAIGADGLPIASYKDGAGKVLATHCSNISCTSSTTNTVISHSLQTSFISIGVDGLPIISFWDTSTGKLAVSHCSNLICSSSTNTASSDTESIGLDSAMSIGTDGLPIIVSTNVTTNDVLATHCSTVTCSSSSTTKFLDADVDSIPSVTIGTDGLAIFAYWDQSLGKLKVSHCSDTPCTTVTTTSFTQAFGFGRYTSITVGADGLPILSAWNTSTNDLVVGHCSNTTCTSATITNFSDSDSVGSYTTIKIGVDGLPLIVSYDATTTDLAVTHCSNIICTSSSTTKLTNSDDIGSLASSSSMAIGTDGLPIIASYDATTGDLFFTHCGSLDCSTTSSTLSGGTSLGSANSFFQSAYIQGINTGSAVNPFTIATNGITRLTFDALGNITAASGGSFDVGALAGDSTTCTGSQGQQNIVVTGGIVTTGGSCATLPVNTLQNAYTNSTGGATPEIVLDTTRNGLNIQDASGTPVSGDLFDVQNNGGTFTYLGVATATISLDTAASGTINIGEANVSGKTINVGSVGSTAQATTIHIADTSATTGQVITLGSISAGTNTTTIQGGNTAAAITLQTAASGSINIGTNNVATKTINIGSVGSTAQSTTIHIADTTDATTAQTLTIGSASATTNQTTLQGGTGVGAVTLATAAGGTINVGSLAFFSSPTSNGVPTVVGTTTSSTTTTTKFSDADNVGQYSSEAIGSDGLPIISSYDATGGALDLAVTHCSNIACTASSTTKFSDADDVGSYSSITIGTDGLAIVSSYDATSGDLAVTHCSNVICTTSTTTKFSDADNVGQYTSIIIGTDGFAIISHYSTTNGDLVVTHCTNTACTASGTTKISDADNVGQYSSIDIGTDGFAIISHYSTTNGDLVVTHCTNTACTASGTTKISDADNVGKYSSLDIGADGFAIISHYSTTNGDLVVTHCTNTACTASGTTKISDADDVGSYSSVNIGSDGFAVVSSYDATGGKLDLTVTHCTNVACTSSATTKLSDSDDVGKYTFLYVGTDGLPIISHYNTTNGDLAVTHCGSLDCSTTSSTLSGGLSLGSQSNPFQKVYATGISTTDAVNPFTIATNGITRLTVDYSGNITAASGSVFNVGASTGLTATCSSGNTINAGNVVGGILSGGSCGAPGGTATLQTSYNGSTSPEITVDATRGALTIQDNATPIAANLLEVLPNGGIPSSAYFAVSAASTTILGGTATGAVSIQGSGTSSIINIATANAANTVQIGNTANAVAQTINIGTDSGTPNTVTIGSTVGTSKTTIQGGSGNIILNVPTGKTVQIGAAATDTNQVLFAADSFSTFSDTATCGASTNQGALYYSTNTNSLRACISGGNAPTNTTLWEDVATTSDLGLQLFGVVPDSGPTPGDWIGINGTLASAGPCKVYLGSANTKIRWTACTAFSGGRKIIVAAQAADYTVTLTSGFTHICLDTSGVVAASAGLNGTEITNLPTFSATAPLLCLADLAVNGSAITEIYDTRTFTTTTKELANNITTGAGIGQIAVQTATAGSVTPSGGATVGKIRGVYVATAAGTTANAINVIIATAGPAYVKGITGASTIGGVVQASATAGKATSVALASVSATDYANMGVSLSIFSSTCGTLADTCRGSLAVNLNIR